MMEVEAALMRAHCDNIRRYRKLLETHLTDVERNYIECGFPKNEPLYKHCAARRTLGPDKSFQPPNMM